MPQGEAEYHVTISYQKLRKEIAYLKEQDVRQLRIWEEKLLEHNTKKLLLKIFWGMWPIMKLSLNC